MWDEKIMNQISMTQYAMINCTLNKLLYCHVHTELCIHHFLQNIAFTNKRCRNYLNQKYLKAVCTDVALLLNP